MKEPEDSPAAGEKWAAVRAVTGHDIQDELRCALLARRAGCMCTEFLAYGKSYIQFALRGEIMRGLLTVDLGEDATS